MKRLILSLVLVVSAAVSGLAQRSDRAIVDAFEGRSKDLLRAVDTATTVQDCAEINASIDALEQEFGPDQPLLDRALYPEDFQTMLTNLRGRLALRQKDMGVIESQFVRISVLEVRVRELTDQVDKLTSDNVQLSAEIERMTANLKIMGRQAAADQRSIDSLRALVKKLQQNLRDRDALVFALVDSIFQQYGKQVMELSDIEKRGIVGKLERQNVLTNVKRAIAENLQFLESTGLKGSDFAELARQQKAFANQWQGLGPKLTQVYYTGKQRGTEVALVDTMLARWAAKADEKLWVTLGALFKERGFALQPFTDGEQFYNGLMMFLQDEIRNIRNEAPAVRSKLFQHFDEGLWLPDLQPVWLPALVETGKLTAGQSEQIEEKVAEWRSSVSGFSWITYVLIGAIIAVLTWVALRLFIWKPKPKPAQEPEKPINKN